jgi:UDP-GlcNAc:undecaprenyl-phosphate GlcNAc-1-phosphate transferase
LNSGISFYAIDVFKILITNMSVFSISFCCAFALVLVLRYLATHLGMIDHPDERKQHAHPIPTVGGVAMLMALLVGVQFGPTIGHDPLVILICASGLSILGVIDDKHNLSVRVRLLIQVFLALIVVHDAHGIINNVGHLFGIPLNLGLLALPISLIALVGAINAFNMIDGADGMAGSMALITTLGATTIFIVEPNGVSLSIPIALMGALIAFLLFNARIFIKRALVFMGDAGSMWIGLVMGWMLIKLTQGTGDPMVGLWLFGLPLIDTISVMVRRMHRKRSPFKADRTHIHHVFERHGYTTGRSVLLSALGHALLVSIGVSLYLLQAPTSLVLGGFAVVLGSYYYVLRHQH